MDTEQRFIELIEHHKRIIYKVCYVYAPGRGQIDDYFQEVVLALWRGFPDFRGESKTATWVYRIALYTCISFVRRRMRRPQSVRLSVDLACDDDMQAREQLDELYAVISRLGRLDRALILLWLEERPAGEIAAITGLSPGNVAVKLTRIRCKLRKMYNRYNSGIMELEELKLKWKVLSERLDREQVIRRKDMERMLRGRVGSYLHYVQLMLLLGVAVVPLCVAIGKFRGVSGIFIWWVVAGYLLCLLPSFFSLWLLLRVSRCDADIVECEHRMTRYAAFAGAYYIFQYVVVILFVAGMLLYAAGYYTAHGMWWTVAALLSLTAVACIVITHHEWGRIRDLQRRIRELREFDEA